MFRPHKGISMQLATSHEPARRPRALQAGLATAAADVEAAQRLRFRVFADEMGARIRGRAPGRDADMFDPWCEHLIVRDTASDEVVGTCRILTAERAKRIGTFCSETHFDLTRLAAYKPHTVEIGRACIHPDYRNGTTIALLWRGVATFMRERGFGSLIGCAPISMSDGGAHAVRVYRHLAPRHLAPIEHQVRPRHVLIERDGPGEAVDGPAPRVPTLLRRYLRLGAWIGGEPSWDPDFNTADLFLFMPLPRVVTACAQLALAEAA
jgi:putative hemolysin